MKIYGKLILIIIITGWVVAMSLQLIDVYIEADKQIAMRERWEEGYGQGYSDAYFKLTGDEPLQE